MELQYLTCKVCKHTGVDYTTKKVGNHMGAYCKCGAWIKWLPQELPKLHFGKYKDKFIHEIDDVDYLLWAFENLKVSKRYTDAMEARIVELRKKI